MDYIQNLSSATATLTQAVGIIQGTRWDATQEEARQYLRSMDMDTTFASGLVADMAADNFSWTLQNLTAGQRATTGRKSIAIWVRKFGFEANMTHLGDVWEITIPRGTQPGPPSARCGACRLWENGLCNCPDSQFYMTARGRGDWNCDDYTHRHHMNRWGCAGIVAFIVAAVAFLGIWMFTGSIWAAIYFFEVIFDIILALAEMFG